MNNKTGFICNQTILTTQQKINSNFCLISLLPIVFSNGEESKTTDFQSTIEIYDYSYSCFSLLLVTILLLFYKNKIIPKDNKSHMKKLIYSRVSINFFILSIV